ncbi:MAG: ATP-binding protein [Proteobacteria bacterium]|nr:ATP-binding protein [Pseudomonadota bacterium]MBU2574557.1 ATP-binding protein [Elusimicrobiota bacterium]
MVYPRIAQARLEFLLRQFPIVTLLGLRQVGKSTFARWALPGFDILDLEDPATLLRLETDGQLMLEQSKKTVIDEAQRLPALFPLLRSHIDRHQNHKIVLLGSASPKLVRKIPESLAGRTGFLELGGISILEAGQEPLWIKGAFPRLHWSRPLASPEDWLPAFLRTYLEQDIPQLGFRVSSQKMMRLLSMLAHSQGSICNLSELGGSLGFDYHSVSHILDIFEGTFLVRRLQPYFANLGKRLVKSPKLYIRDTGILHHLLGIPFNKKALLSHPKAGASFETFCIEQIINLARLEDPAAEVFFFRTQTGVEVDLLLKLRGELIPIGIKLSLAARNIARLERGMGYLGLKRGFIVHMAEGFTEIRRGIWAGSLARVMSCLFRTAKPASPGK